MPKASWNGVMIAEAPEDKVQMVEGNVYFPPESVRQEYLQRSDKATTCPWKGVASYYHIVVGNAVNQDAAWTYATPKEAAKHIAGHIAFWHGVNVEK